MAVNRTVRVVVVDDEPLARENLRLSLAADDRFVVVGEAATGTEAIAIIAETRPDVVFLDIKMPSGGGFDVIADLVSRAERERSVELPIVIFVTAYDEYAIRAYDAHALDYLLKPYDDARFSRALDHAIQRLRERDALKLGDRLRAAMAELSAAGAAAAAGTARHATPPGPPAPQRLLVTERDRAYFVDLGEIAWLEADGAYVRLHTARRVAMIRRALSALLATLDPHRFVRVHRGAAVNVDFVCAIEPGRWGDGTIHLTTGTRLPLGRRWRNAVERTLGVRTR
jgi:two-component system LytT family response regulator